ncbi:hypothetical protein NM688_g6560 [Phlebia brevispora]|uniref:Uncharacterized protein n=1 Tax=Phlebia brevispora TaxID=194682 RepID=A0ACC1SF09_9APHY|nr:hypothetical protein NM688_g6560 [Phlebia brevispora]
MPDGLGSQLTTSRISRLLRPLRTKCVHLAAISNTKSKGVAITYGSSSRHSSQRSSSENDSPPLAVIPPPEKLSTLSGSDRPTRDDMQLSKGIYDVRDAFRNVIQATFGVLSTPYGGEENTILRMTRVRSLASICASVIGDHIEDQARLHDEGDEAEDEEDMEILSELYEAIPPHFRRFTVVAHALSLILETCPRHPSLLQLLLEASLPYGLIPESCTLLYHLLDLAFRPQPASFSPRITHPAHLNYLTTLLDTCGKHAKDGAAVINDPVFARAVVDVLLTAPEPLLVDAWTCKALSRLVRRLQTRDFAVFLLFPTSLLIQCSGRHWTLFKASKTRLHDADSANKRLTERLTKWLDAACRHVYLHRVDLASDPHVMAMLAGLLVEASAIQRKFPQDDAEVDPTDLLVCLSTLFLDMCPSTVVSDCRYSMIVDFLRRTRPNTRTFATLAVLSLPSSPTDDPTQPCSDISDWDAFATVGSWAEALRAKGCLLHEASLWSTFLSHVEGLLSELSLRHFPISFTRSLEELRSKVVNRVEEAERRTFGSYSRVAQALPAFTPRKGSGGATDVEWRWDDIFDCWVTKTPATIKPAPRVSKRARSIEPIDSPVKRRRIQDDFQENYASPVQLRRALDDSVLRGRQARRGMDSPHSSRTSTSMSPSPLHRSKSAAGLQFPSDDEDDDDIILMTPIRPFGRRKANLRPSDPGPLDRRKSLVFRSIVADALKNKVVLHPKRHPEPLPLRTRAVDDVEESDAGVCTVDQLSSDDALNLFAYMSSEC